MNETADSMIKLHRTKLASEESSTFRQKNVTHDLLVPKENIYLLPLHILLRLIKQFAKAIDKTSKLFKFFEIKFPCLSETKIRE